MHAVNCQGSCGTDHPSPVGHLGVDRIVIRDHPPPGAPHGHPPGHERGRLDRRVPGEPIVMRGVAGPVRRPAALRGPLIRGQVRPPPPLRDAALPPIAEGALLIERSVNGRDRDPDAVPCCPVERCGGKWAEGGVQAAQLHQTISAAGTSRHSKKTRNSPCCPAARGDCAATAKLVPGTRTIGSIVGP